MKKPCQIDASLLSWQAEFWGRVVGLIRVIWYDFDLYGDYMAKSSPFESLHREFGANFSTYHNWSMPSDYGDSMQESAGLYANCAAFDLSSFGRIRFEGSDSGKLLEYVDSNAKKRDSGKWGYGIFCDSSGKLLDISRVFSTSNNGSSLVICSPPKREILVSHFQNIVKEQGLKQVKITDVTEQTSDVALFGPKSMDLIDRLLPFDLSDIDGGGFKNYSAFMMNVTIIRGSFLGVDGIEIISPVAAASLAGGAVKQYYQQNLASPGGMDCLNRAMVEAGLPLSVDCRNERCRFSPVSMGLGDLIDFDRDFCGKDALIKEHENGPARLAVGVKLARPGSFHRDLNVQHDDLEIGWVDSIVPSERLGCSVGIAEVDNEFYDICDEVQICGDGIVMGGEICSLPIDKSCSSGIYQSDGRLADN